MAELSSAADKVTEAASLGAEAVEEVAAIARNHIAWFWSGLGVGLVSGLGGGFLAARKYLEPKYEKISEDEIDQMREHFRKRLLVREEKPDLSVLAVQQKVDELGYTDKPIPTRPTPAPSTAPPPPGEPNVQPAESFRNVFEATKSPEEGWDYEVEKGIRERRTIFVIHQDEFGETDNEKVTLAYYEGDDVLCDDQDKIINDQDKLVASCLDRFGHGSGDSNIVYVRNEELGIDMEVIKSHKTYAEEVHGLKHEDPPRRRDRRES